MTAEADPSNPYGLLGGGTPRLGNGSLYVPPNFNNMPTGFGYSSLNDQLRDAMLGFASGSGSFKNMATPVLGGIKESQPLVGGGLLGKTAYSGNNPWTGWDPYQGRGNGPGGPPGGGAPPPGGGGAPPGGGVTPGLPPPSGGGPRLPPPGYPGNGQPPTNPRTNPNQPPPPLPPPTSAITPNGPPGGLLSPRGPVAPPPTLNAAPRSTQQSPTGLAPGAMSTGAMPYTAAQVSGGGAGEQSPEAMAKYFMSLPESQRGDFFNAVGQYGALTGNQAGGALDQALRAMMGDSQFRNWLTTMDTQQGSTIRSAEGLPSWITAVVK